VNRQSAVLLRKVARAWPVRDFSFSLKSLRTLSTFSALALVASVASSNAVAPYLTAQGSAAGSHLTFEIAPTQTKISFTLHATAHNVHGEFDLKHGEIKVNPTTGAISGEIVVDARSGRSGNDSRDANMRHDVLDVDKFPEIVFRPDRVTNFDSSRSAFQAAVHGTFSIRGADHELTVPVQINLTGGNWNASGKFSVPYVDWGMHDPSNFFLHVAHTVDIEVQMGGTSGGSSGSR
jgi:polyisoprenoid-binding protein YceI